MKPGDLIEWHYQSNDDDVQVVQDEELWSSLMKQWVPIRVVSTLLYRNNEIYIWINSKGLFFAHTSDKRCAAYHSLYEMTVDLWKISI
jgi:hypothetical protein